jgi:hypothetical protein
MMLALKLLGELFYEEDSFFVFVLVTLILGGGAAFLAGRAIALTWRPWWQVPVYMIVLGGVVRFFHMALFEGHLLSLHYYLVDTAFCLAFGFWGFRMTRAGQMAEQYGWLYRRNGPLSWAKKRPEPNAAGPKSG